jgi:hypothetical protein
VGIIARLQIRENVMTFEQRVMTWAVQAFGYDCAHSTEERALRVVEEALEFAQASGVTPAQIERLASRVYSKPSGLRTAELRDLCMAVAAATATFNTTMLAAGEEAFARVHAMPLEHWRERQAEKMRAGVAMPSSGGTIDPPKYQNDAARGGVAKVGFGEFEWIANEIRAHHEADKEPDKNTAIDWVLKLLAAFDTMQHNTDVLAERQARLLQIVNDRLGDAR